MKKLTGIERCKVHKKPKKIDSIVRGVCIYWVLFVIVAWVTYWVKDGVPDTLIQYGLGGSVLELVMTALIEISRDISARKDGKNSALDN